ncbi:MAG: cytochrome c [Bacteroidota bacterium]
MNTRLNNTLSLLAVALLLILSACQQPEDNSPGSEYMPDMGHSIAYEANHYDYYYYNTWGSEEEYYKIAKPRKPVKGTIPRGYAGVHYAAQKANATALLTADKMPKDKYIPTNGSVPYYYADTEAERTRATNEILVNPFPITDKGLADAKELYNIFCGICHGEKGGGNGYIVREDGGVYPAQPASFLTDEFQAASNGRYYHAIMHGKNVMGNYKDKLSYEERWQVIHYIRALQAKDKGLVYDETENTLNSNDYNVPGSKVKVVATKMESHDGDHGHGDGDHSSHDGDHSGDAEHSHEGGDHDHGTHGGGH